jgi:hypothetical protein
MTILLWNDENMFDSKYRYRYIIKNHPVEIIVQYYGRTFFSKIRNE